MQKASNSFFIGALFNGTTVNGVLRSTTALVQRFVRDTDSFTPNYETMAENSRPVVYPFIRLTNDGTIKAPYTYEWFYNSVKLEFDPTTKLSTTGSMEGVFKEIDYKVTVGNEECTVPAIRIMKNLVPISNYDNDIIYMSGTIEMAGQLIPFEKLDKTIIIEETTGNQFDLILKSDKEFGFMSENESMKVTAHVSKDGVEVVDLSGYTFRWYKLTADGNIQITGVTSNMITLTTDDVDSALVIRCDLLKDGGVICSAYETIYDFSDPYHIEFLYSGNTLLSVGESVTVTPKVMARDGSSVTGYTSFKFAIRDAAGNPFKPSQYESSEFTASSCKLLYEDVTSANRMITGYVSTN